MNLGTGDVSLLVESLHRMLEAPVSIIPVTHRFVVVAKPVISASGGRHKNSRSFLAVY